MYRVTISFGQPHDPAAFHEYYRHNHLPLAGTLPGLRRLAGGRCESPDGEEPPAYYLSELCFPSRVAALTALASPQGRRTAADIVNFATGGATFAYSDEEVVIEL
jgi:uncharacterized protein (TIGR02118 family)